MSSTDAPTIPGPSPVALALAEKLRESREDLAQRWLERIVAHVALPANRVFPTQELLDHVPRLIDGIADQIAAEAADIGTEGAVEAEAIELGELRHSQGFDANQILKEYALLGSILFHHLVGVADEVAQSCSASEVLYAAQRLFEGIAVVQQTTTLKFLRLAEEAVTERETRLRAFNRMVSHEIKNDIGAVLGAGEILKSTDDLSAGERNEMHDVITRRARSMKATLDTLVELSQLDVAVRTPRHLRLPDVIKEAARRVREKAQAQGIEIRISATIPDVEVNAAVVEFSLANYLSNAIKYSRKGAPDSVIDVDAEAVDGNDGATNRREIVVRVRDNGLGVAPEKRGRLFERFYRAHADSAPVEGMGLGLSLVREMIESIDGRAWAEFPPNQTVFAFAIPPA